MPLTYHPPSTPNPNIFQMVMMRRRGGDFSSFEKTAIKLA
jgi:hypothetical protein